MAERTLISENEVRPRFDRQDQWYLLGHTGFNVRLQIDQFERDLANGISKGKSTEEIIEASFQKIEQDIQGFKTEYLCEGLLFPIVLDKDVTCGQERIVAPLYGKKLFVETVSDKERRGAVKNSIRQVEQFLLNAPPGSIAVMTSPEGWSGFDGITYLDTQTYIWRVMENGEPMGFGVRTDMLLDQNRQFLKTMGKDIPLSVSAKDQIVDIVASPVLIDVQPGQKPWQFEDVVDIIKNVKGTHFAYKNRSFSEIYESLQKPENLWTLDETTKKLTENLKDFFRVQLSEGQFNRQDLEMALGTTILKLAYAIRKPGITHNQEHSRRQSATGAVDIPYRAILMKMQSLPGCNGGGNTAVGIFTSSIVPRFAIGASSLPVAERTLSCKCPFCHLRVDAIIANGKIICPNCEKSAPYEC